MERASGILIDHHNTSDLEKTSKCRTTPRYGVYRKRDHLDTCIDINLAPTMMTAVRPIFELTYNKRRPKQVMERLSDCRTLRV